ncbi:MAG: hypothetical protein VX772_10315 [Bacteroidota bacterium]|uniref:Lipoprotein n=1 Tax=Flagellimonas okinawensis TaxID=3031324 RepID=A0ABT5XNQ3_9FLAO|nr:hypothetical protein [[Muricauda] okinawensis]MDF0707524.1 hypothetical protein [[Muricauda] okinawensis]MEC8832742.1 hypothetical protein [Bacteroidota bacterium]
MRRLVLMFLVLFCLGCKDGPKEFTDYDKDDFFEVQGIVVEVDMGDSEFGKISTDVCYYYNLSEDKPSLGCELNCPLLPEIDDPIIVMIHKDDPDIAFVNRLGVLEQDRAYLREYLDKKAKNIEVNSNRDAN